MRSGEPDGGEATSTLPARSATAHVTFLFTDIESSTRAWEDHPGAMSISLARHDELVHRAVKDSGGTVFKHTGDGICAAFSTAPAALEAALAAQCALQAEDWHEAEALRVRMAIHTGVAEQRAGDFFGPPLNRAARLLSTAHGGQTLLSLVTAELVRDELPPGADLRDLGEHRLADLTRPERVFQLDHPALPAAFPALRSLAAHRHNLPVATSSFIGRDRELAAIGDLLAGSRLVTLIGVGGVGKTRLALQVAAGMLETYPDGVFLIDLAPLADAAMVAAQAARALGVVESKARTAPEAVVEGLCDYLERRTTLLVFDNCEHLIEAVAVLCDAILQRGPAVAVLCTSREALAIGGEIAWRVPPLALPPTEDDALHAVLGGDAMSLFSERARAADPEFAITPDNASAVTRICRRLDGIPLALELAAARIRVLSPDQVADRLDDRFRLLKVGSRTAAPRQQTLRATMDWSYDLLSEAERLLLQRLSVFAGSFDLDAVEAVTSDGTTIDRADVLDLLTRLVDKSLVGVRGQGLEARYRLLETVRQYGDEKLTETGARDEVRRSHRDYYLRMADTYLDGDPFAEGRWLRRFDLSYDNLRAALEWSLAHDDADAGLHIVATLSNHWVLAGHFGEGRARLEQALALNPQTRSRVRVRVMNGLGFLLDQQGEFDRSLALHSEALTLAIEAGDEGEAGVGAFFVGARLLHQGDVERASQHLHDAHNRFRAVGSSDGMAWCEMMLGWVAVARSDHPQATRSFKSALERGRPSAGENLMAHALGGLAQLAALAGDADRAQAYAKEGIAAARRLGLQTILVMSLVRATEVAVLIRRWASAHETLRELLAVLRNTGGRAFLADSLEITALVQEVCGRPISVARLLGASQGVREASHETSDVRTVSPDLERCHARLIDLLGPAEFASEWEWGRALSPAESVVFGLRELDRDPSTVPGPPVPKPKTATLRRAGKQWVVGYRDVRFELPASKGLAYLARLLADPGREVHVLDLVAAAQGGGPVDRGDAGPILDSEAKAAYRRRVRELQEEIDEARSWNDPDRAARAEMELEALTRQLAAAVGLGGRDRPAAAPAERARVSVRKALAGAISRIAEHDADLGLLLSTTVKTGTYCCYTPDPRLPVVWVL